MSYSKSYSDYLGANRCCNNNSAGAQGPQGSQGLGGPLGPKGTQGSTGSTGATGSQGSQGETGVQGPEGSTGARGAQGLRGITGAQGSTGATGAQGSTGLTTGLVLYLNMSEATTVPWFTNAGLLPNPPEDPLAINQVYSGFYSSPPSTNPPTFVRHLSITATSVASSSVQQTFTNVGTNYWSTQFAIPLSELDNPLTISPGIWELTMFCNSTDVPDITYNYRVYGYNGSGPSLTPLAVSGSQTVLNSSVSSVSIPLIFTTDIDVTMYTHIIVIICGTCINGGGTQLATTYYESLATYSHLHTTFSAINGVTGPQGAQGATGATGAVGITGATGATGAQGLQGVTGAQGAAGAGGATGYYGSFYDTTPQGPFTSGTAYPVTINSTDVTATNSIYIGSPTSRIYNTYTGIYNIQFSAQFSTTSTGNDVDLVNIWIKKNGANVPDTDGQVSIPTKAGGSISSWNYLLALNAGDYIEFYLKCISSSNVSLTTLTGGGIPPNDNPASPSIIVTYMQAAYNGPTGAQGATGPGLQVLGAFGTTGATASMLMSSPSATGTTGIYYSDNLKYYNPGSTANPTFWVTGDLLPPTTNTYSLGKTGNTWKDIAIGPGTLTFEGPTGTLPGSLGANLAGIVYTPNGFATPYINVGPAIDPGVTAGTLGGWNIGVTGTPGATGFDLVAQQIVSGGTGYFGPVYSLINGRTGATGAQGSTGPEGKTGSPGPVGSTGPEGKTGSPGLQGVTGAQGLQGVTGAQGLQGVTGSPGPVGATGAQGLQGVTGTFTSYWASFYSTVGQTGTVGVHNDMTFNNINPASNGITGGTGSRITVGNTGVYNIQFSAQVTRTGGPASTYNIWLSVGGTGVTGTNRVNSLQAGNLIHVPSWNYVQSLNAGQYVELSWYSADTTLYLPYYGATAYGAVQVPSSPSVIATIQSLTSS
jgi:hypothetical protein